ncbi:MAG TPA: hypothetical protein VIU29_05095 [Candidatus Deferrimicrobiaceae bacterium]
MAGLSRSLVSRRFLVALPIFMLAFACGGGGGGGTVPPAPPAIPGRTFGGSGSDFAWSAQQTSDGGYAFAGFTNSSGAGGYDAWLVKTDSAGNLVRQRTIGTAGNDFAFSLQQTTDGGYIVAGVDNVVFGALPTSGFWIPLDFSGELTLRKLNADFSTAWETRVGGLPIGAPAFGFSMGYSVRQTIDGGYVVSGATGTGGGGGVPLLLLADAAGNVTRTSFLAGELGTGVRQAVDTGFVVSTAGVGGNALTKVNFGGTQEWSRPLLGSGLAVGTAADGGFIVAGDNGSVNAGDVHVAKIDAVGNVSWERNFGSPGGDAGFSIRQNPDGSYILAGAGSGGGFNHGFDMYLVRLDAFGAIAWERHFGGTGDDVGRSVERTADGGYIVAGSTTSGGAGGLDAYLVKTDSNGVSQW